MKGECRPMYQRDWGLGGQFDRVMLYCRNAAEASSQADTPADEPTDKDSERGACELITLAISELLLGCPPSQTCSVLHCWDQGGSRSGSVTQKLHLCASSEVIQMKASRLWIDC